MEPLTPAPAPWRMALSGLSASLIGIGLARFAYTPLLPAVIAAGWFSPADAAYLGAANLAGYLLGALLAPPVAARLPAVPVLRVMMALAAASFFACGFPVSFAWFFVWRFAAGIAGGILMALVAPTVLPHVPHGRRGLVGGAIFVGVGCGIVASGTVVPALLTSGLGVTWWGLGALCAVLTAVAWGGWPSAAALPAVARPLESASSGAALRALYVSYGLIAIGLVPHMVFLVDFIVRGLGQGLTAGAHCWVLFGLGAVVGPMLAGAIADRIGFGPTLRLTLLAQAVAVGALAVTTGPLALAISSVAVGAFVPGSVAIVLGRMHELVPADHHRQRAAWSWCTTAFALGQAAGAYGLSYLFARTGGAYDVLFVVGALALAAALALELAMLALPAAATATEP